MNRTANLQDTVFPDCPIRNVLARIADKWSLLVLYTMTRQSEPIRFKALQRSIPDISTKMLTTTLRTLEQDGFVSRKVFAEVPPRVEYKVTNRTQSLMPLVDALISWASDNFSPILADRKKSLQS